MDHSGPNRPGASLKLLALLQRECQERSKMIERTSTATESSIPVTRDTQPGVRPAPKARLTRLHTALTLGIFVPMAAMSVASCAGESEVDCGRVDCGALPAPEAGSSSGGSGGTQAAGSGGDAGDNPGGDAGDNPGGDGGGGSGGDGGGGSGGDGGGGSGGNGGGGTGGTPVAGTGGDAGSEPGGDDIPELDFGLDAEEFDEVELVGCEDDAINTVAKFESDYINAKCANCHANALPRLNFKTAGENGEVGDLRLELLKSTEEVDENNNTNKCYSSKNVDVENWQNSVLYITARQNFDGETLICPDPNDLEEEPNKMPKGGGTNDEVLIDCMEAYVKAIIGGSRAME